MNYKFEILPLNWFKRRLPTQSNDIVSVIVHNFEKIDNHPCSVDVVFEDDTRWNSVPARVNHNTRFEYQPDGSCKEIHLNWGVQAQHEGIGVLVRLVE